MAQKEFTGKKIDWVQQVSKDLDFCDIRNTENEIWNMKEETFRKIVVDRLNMKAKERLTGLQMDHSKTMYLCQDTQMAEYLRSLTRDSLESPLP